MPKSTRIPSPARSQGAPLTPRRHRSTRTRSVGSPARSNASGRLTLLLREKMDSFALSPMPDRRSILTDDTNIEEPRRKSWWKKLNENSRDVIELLDHNKDVETDVIGEYIDIDVLSQDKNNYTNDLPESSDSESINSIVMPQRNLFTKKDSQPQKKFGQLVGNRESMAKLHKTNSAPDKTINAGTKNLFPSNKQRSRPVFPSALLNISPNKTVAEKTKELPAEPPKNQVRNIFGNRPATKRKNMFTEFIMSDSDDEDIPEIQPKIFGFQKQSDAQQSVSAAPSKMREPSPPTFNFTTDEMDDWKLLPSSTMIDKQLENTITATPVKKTRLSKLSEDKESEIETNMNVTEDTTKQSNKSTSSKNKSKLSNNNKTIAINTSVRNKSNSKLNKSPNKTLSENNEKNKHGTASLVINNEIDTKNKSQTRNKTGIIDKSKQINQTNSSTIKNAETVDNDKNQDEDENNFTLHYDQDEHDHVVTATTNLKNIHSKSDDTKLDKNQEEMEIDDDYEDEIELDVSNELQGESHEDSLKHNETQICLKQVNLQQNASKKLEESKHIQNDPEVSQKIQNKTVQQAHIESVENEEHIEYQHEKEEDNECEENEMYQEIQNNSDVNQDIEQDTEDNQDMDNDTAENQETGNNTEESQEIENDTAEKQEINSDIEENQETENDTEENQEIENDTAENHEIDSDIGENEETENYALENHEIDSDDEVHQDTDNNAAENQEINSDIEENEETENDAEENHEIDSDDEVHQDTDNNVAENQEIDSDVDDNEEIEHTEGNQDIENDSEEKEESQVQSENDDKEEESEEVHSENEDNQSENEADSDVDDNQGLQYESEEEIQNESHSREDVIERTKTPDSNQAVHSPEAILHDKTNHIHSFTAHNRNTTARKTKSLHQSLFFRPSMAPPRESTSMTDRTGNSSAGSEWDSHRVTRKTIRLTFAKELTPRKSLRALVMEKSAKRQTAHNDLHSTANLPQSNSTEMSNYCDAEDQMDITDQEAVKRTRQATLDEYMKKIRERNMKIRIKAEEAVKNSLNTQPNTTNPFKVPTRLPNAARRPPKIQRRPHNGHINSLVPMDDLPPELLEDMKYKPPKRFKPGNAAWITKRLYKYLETKLEPRYDYKARVRSEQLVETIYDFAKNLRKHKVAPRDAVDGLKHEMARLDIVKTHFEFYQFFHDFMPREIRIKVVPDVANDLPLPTHGVYSDIIRGNAMQE